MKECESLKVSMVTHVEEEPLLLFLSCAVEVSKEEEWEVIVTVRPVVLHLPQHTLCDALHIQRDTLVFHAGGKETHQCDVINLHLLHIVHLVTDNIVVEFNVLPKIYQLWCNS